MFDTRYGDGAAAKLFTDVVDAFDSGRRSDMVALAYHRLQGRLGSLAPEDLPGPPEARAPYIAAPKDLTGRPLHIPFLEDLQEMGLANAPVRVLRNIGGAIVDQRLDFGSSSG